jgi:hypothetical protein
LAFVICCFFLLARALTLSRRSTISDTVETSDGLQHAQNRNTSLAVRSNVCGKFCGKTAAAANVVVKEGDDNIMYHRHSIKGTPKSQ